MGSMMARSTPSIFLHSPLARYSVTALEFLAAVNSVIFFITLCALHIRFVKRDGCSMLLREWNLHSNSPNYVYRPASPFHGPISPVIEMSIIDPDIPSYTTFPQKFRFSHERGFLLLSDDSLRTLNVSVAHISLDRHHPCLGDPLARFILFHFVGYEAVAMNAFARMRRRIGKRDGYVLSLQSKRVLNLLHADPDLFPDKMNTLTRLSLRILWKFGTILTAVFIMCTTGALVAFTLKEVQVRMIKLTIDLQVIMRSQLGYGRVILRYAMDALVFVPIIAGMLFFLFEFFDDQALAFAVLVITWLCEFAASGTTRHWISRLYLPRLFFCYFGAFHVYFFSFPLGFSWLAFATSLVFMSHASLSVWNHCEIPLLRRERDIQSDWR